MTTLADSMKMFAATGGPAFPADWKLPDGGSLGCPGMTLRDWFAGQALAGIMASPVEVTGKDLAEAHQNTSRICYSAADAMIAERLKGESQ